MHVMLYVLWLWGFLCAGSVYGAGDKYYFVSLGDSITTAFNTRWIGDMGNAKYSWATGESEQVTSYVKRLQAVIKEEIAHKNVAVAGAKSHELGAQLREIEFSRIDYATLLIGANDVCEWNDDHRGDLRGFRNNITRVVEYVLDNNAEAKILLSSVPDMYHLYEQGKRKCQFKWNIFKICPRLLHSARTEAERLLFRAQVVDANRVLREVSNEHANNVKYVPEVFEYQFTLNHLSGIDCFHPSILGQSTLAELAWAKGWY